MKLIKGVVKFLVYLWFIWPLTRSIIVSILGYGFGRVVAVLVMIGLIFYLEKSKIVTNLIDRIFRHFNIDKQFKSQATHSHPSNIQNLQLINAIKSTKTCENCGAVIELLNGKGICDSCDTYTGN